MIHLVCNSIEQNELFVSLSGKLKFELSSALAKINLMVSKMKKFVAAEKKIRYERNKAGFILER